MAAWRPATRNFAGALTDARQAGHATAVIDGA